MAIREIANVPNLLTISRIFLTPLFLAMLFADTWYWRAWPASCSPCFGH